MRFTTDAVAEPSSNTLSMNGATHTDTERVGDEAAYFSDFNGVCMRQVYK
jgi:hypothetical protein